MSAGRRWIITGCLLAVVLLHLYAAWGKKEAWPFSGYALYSLAYGDIENITDHRLMAETTDGRTIRLKATDLIDKSPGLWLQRLIPDLNGYNVPMETRHESMAGIAALYESRRIAGRHDGPPLRRLYATIDTRPLLADASNTHAPPSRRVYRIDYIIEPAPAPPPGTDPPPMQPLPGPFR